MWFSGCMNLTLNPKLKKKETNVDVILNGENILCTLKNYINLYTSDSFEEKEIIIESFDRWEIGVVLSNNHKFLQVSISINYNQRNVTCPV